MSSSRLILWVFILPAVYFSSCTVSTEDPVDYVDPLIGTGASTTISALRHSEASNEPRGQTFPAVGFPFGMTQWTPQTHHSEVKCLSPYYASSDSLSGFRGSHWMSGSCTQDYGSVTLMPMSGDLILDPVGRATPYLKSSQISSPYYYSVYLPDEDIFAELSANQRSGIMAFRFNSTEESYILLEPNSDEGVGYVQIDPEKGEVSGHNPAHRIYQGWGEYAGFNGYFVAQFDTPFAEHGTWDAYNPLRDNLNASGDSSSVGVFLRFSTSPGDVVKVRIGTSFTSIDAARNNLNAEIPDWDIEKTSSAAKSAWNNALTSISVISNNNGADDAPCPVLHRSLPCHDVTTPVQ